MPTLPTDLTNVDGNRGERVTAVVPFVVADMAAFLAAMRDLAARSRVKYGETRIDQINAALARIGAAA